MKRDSSTTNTVISQNAWTYVRYVVRPAMYRVTSGHDPLVIYHPSFLWRGKLLKLYHCEQLARSRQRKRLDSKGGRGSSERVEKTRKKLPPTTIPDKLMIFFSPRHVCLSEYTNYRGCNDDRVLSSASSAKFSRGERFFDARRPDGLRLSLLWLFIVLSSSPFLFLFLFLSSYTRKNAPS